jgi:hypothetical protein
MSFPCRLCRARGAIRDTAGMIKMVADRDTDEVLGVSMVGNNAGEVIHEAAMGLRFHPKISDFIDLLHVIPRWPRLSKSSPFPAAKTRKAFVLRKLDSYRTGALPSLLPLTGV